MLGKLDPYTVYVPPAQQEAFDRMLEGSFKGVGIQLEQDEKTLQIEVVTPIEGSPAFKAGVMASDVILKVNGEDLAGLRLPDVIKKIAGPLGSPVTLTVRHVDGRAGGYHDDTAGNRRAADQGISAQTRWLVGLVYFQRSEDRRTSDSRSSRRTVPSGSRRRLKNCKRKG